MQDIEQRAEGFKPTVEPEFFNHIGNQHVVTAPNHESIVPIISLDAPANQAIVLSNDNVTHAIYEVTVAKGFFSRLRGLMGRKTVPESLVMVFPNCSSVHCMFMSAEIDIVYMDEEWHVLASETVAPWKRTHAPKGTKHVAEMAPGLAEKWGILPGDPMMFVEMSMEEHRMGKMG